MNKLLPVISVLTILGHPGVSLASADANNCSVISDNIARLSCFDELFPGNPIPTEQATKSATPIESRESQEEAALYNWFAITPHRQNYVLPISHNFSSDFSEYGAFGDLFNDTEIKFQLSLKTQLWPNMWRRSSLWAAYTQQSYWQLYADKDASAPFRETNHEPELIWQFPVQFKLFGLNARIASLSFVHQSNGQSEPLSRSWNRVAGELVFERGRFVASAKTWLRVDDPTVDDNPDIEDYMGRIQLGVAYKGDRHTLALGLKNNLSSENRSGVEFDWTFPLAQHLRGFLQVYSGYGENLIDMENYSNRVSIGLALTDWL